MSANRGETGMRLSAVVSFCFVVQAVGAGAVDSSWPEYSTNPFVISLDQDPPTNTAGGIARTAAVKPCA